MEAKRGQVGAGTPWLNSAPASSTDLKLLVRALKQQAESQAIVNTLHSVNGRRKEAARLLNISLRALVYKMREYGVDSCPAADSAEPFAAGERRWVRVSAA